VSEGDAVFDGVVVIDGVGVSDDVGDVLTEAPDDDVGVFVGVGLGVGCTTPWT
jgi:hypothetical protein